MTAIAEPAAPSETQSSGWRSVALVRTVATAVATVILLAPLTFGFRPTADEKAFTFTGMTRSVWDWLAIAWPSATGQGRVGQLLALPTAYLSGRFGDMAFYPYFCIGMFLTIVVALFVWWARLTESRSLAAPVLIYLALLPAGFHSWLPNAYLLDFVYLPLGLAAKALMLRNSDRWQGVGPNLLCSLLILLAAINYELHLVLLTILFGFELCVMVADRRSRRQSVVTPLYARWNAVVLLLAAIVFAAFRYHFGSSYDGNQFPTTPFDKRTLLVTGLHILSASAWPTTLDAVRIATTHQAIAASVLFAALGLALYLSPAPRRPWLWIAFGALVTVAMAFPVAMEDKFQTWCLQYFDCSYTDGRYVLIGLAAIAFGALSLLPRTTLVRAAVAAIVALVGVQDFLQNAQAFAPLRNVAAGRELLAKRYVCGDRSLGATPDSVATHLALDPLFNDPNGFHPWHDAAWRKTYWLTYIDHLQHSRFWLCP